MTTPLIGMVWLLAPVSITKFCSLYLHPLRRYKWRYKVSKMGGCGS